MLRPIHGSAALLIAAQAILSTTNAWAQDATVAGPPAVEAPQAQPVTPATPPAAQPTEPPVAPTPVPQTLPTVPTPASRAPTEPGGLPFRVTGTPGQGVTFDTLDDRLSLNIRGRIMVREMVLQPPTGPASNTTTIHAARVILGGHLFSRDVTYFLQMGLSNDEYDTSNSTASPLYDAWVAWAPVREFHLRAGQFLVGFDKQRTNLDVALQFVDRSSVVSEFTLDRDVGVEISSQDVGGFDGMLQYAVGMYSGQGRNRPAESPPGFMYVGRVQLDPMGTFDDSTEADLAHIRTPHLAIGAAAAFNHNAVRQRGTLGAPLLYGTFNYTSLTADLTFKWQGFSLIAEIISRHADHNDNVGVSMMHNVTEYSRSGYGYFAQAGYAVTQHFEFGARYDQLFADTGTDPTLVSSVSKIGHDVGGVLSYYFYGHPLKLQTDYFYEWGDNFSAGSHQWRLQLQAAF